MNNFEFSKILNKNGFLLILLFSIGQLSYAQLPPKVKWEKAFGGHDVDMVYDIMATTDDSYLLTGYSKNNDRKEDLWVFKISGAGKMLWSKLYGGAEFDEGRDIVKTDDESFLIAGTTASKGSGEKDIWLLKIDGAGNKIWEKTFGERKSETTSAVIRTKDNGFLVVGSKHKTVQTSNGKQGFSFNMEHYIWMIKVDREGNLIWEQLMPTENMATVTDVYEAEKEGFVLVANTRAKKSIYEDTYLIKTDRYGNKEWEKSFGGKASDIVHAIYPLDDHSLIMAGVTASSGKGKSDGWLLKVNSNGKLLWEKTFGDVGTDAFHGLTTTDSGEILVTGSFGSATKEEGSVWIIKTDDVGNKIWEKTCGEGYFEKGIAVLQTFAGEIFVASNTPTQLIPKEDGTMPTWEEGEKINGNMRLTKFSRF